MIKNLPTIAEYPDSLVSWMGISMLAATLIKLNMSCMEHVWIKDIFNNLHKLIQIPNPLILLMTTLMLVTTLN